MTFKLAVRVHKVLWKMLTLQNSRIMLNSLVGEVMYLFNFVQQIWYPNNPDQAGELFFKVPRKCLLFGVINERWQKQFTYVIDKTVDCGKGSNIVISYLYHYLYIHRVGGLVSTSR